MIFIISVVDKEVEGKSDGVGYVLTLISNPVNDGLIKYAALKCHKLSNFL